MGALIVGLGAESAAQSAITFGAAAGGTITAGPAGGGGATVATSAYLEYLASFEQQLLEEIGDQPVTSERLLKVLEDDGFRERIKERAAQRGLAVGGITGLFDAVSGGIAGKIVAKSAGKGLARQIGGVAGGVSSSTMLSAFGGSTAEFVALVLARENPFSDENQKAIAAEAPEQLAAQDKQRRLDTVATEAIIDPTGTERRVLEVDENGEFVMNPDLAPSDRRKTVRLTGEMISTLKLGQLNAAIDTTISGEPISPDDVDELVEAGDLTRAAASGFLAQHYSATPPPLDRGRYVEMFSLIDRLSQGGQLSGEKLAAIKGSILGFPAAEMGRLDDYLEEQSSPPTPMSWLRAEIGRSLTHQLESGQLGPQDDGTYSRVIEVRQQMDEFLSGDTLPTRQDAMDHLRELTRAGRRRALSFEFRRGTTTDKSGLLAEDASRSPTGNTLLDGQGRTSLGEVVAAGDLPVSVRGDFSFVDSTMLADRLSETLRDYAPTIVDEANRYLIDPRFLAASFEHEMEINRDLLKEDGEHSSEPDQLSHVVDAISNYARRLTASGGETVREIGAAFRPPGAGDEEFTENDWWSHRVAERYRELTQ